MLLKLLQIFVEAFTLEHQALERLLQKLVLVLDRLPLVAQLDKVLLSLQYVLLVLLILLLLEGDFILEHADLVIC